MDIEQHIRIIDTHRRAFACLFTEIVYDGVLYPVSYTHLVGDILGFNAKRKEVIFQGVDGTGSNNFAVNVNTGKRSLPFSFRSTTEGEHNGMLSASGSYLIDRYSTPTLPRRIDIVDTKSLKTVNLLTAKDPYEGYEDVYKRQGLSCHNKAG